MGSSNIQLVFFNDSHFKFCAPQFSLQLLCVCVSQIGYLIQQIKKCNLTCLVAIPSIIERPKNIVSNKLIKAICYVQKWCPQLFKNGQWHHDMSEDTKLVSPNSHNITRPFFFHCFLLYLCSFFWWNYQPPHFMFRTFHFQHHDSLFPTTLFDD